MSSDKTKLNIEVYNGERFTHALTGTEVEVEAWVGPHTGVVTVTREGVKVRLVDHDGEHVSVREIKFADMGSGELEEELKVLDTVQRTAQEAGIGKQPNPLHSGEEETQKAQGETPPGG